MMQVRFYFSFRSPFAGIAFWRLHRLQTALDIDFRLMPVWPEIISGGQMDNPTDNLYKLSYVFHDAVRQAEEAGLDTGQLKRIAGSIPSPGDVDIRRQKGLTLPPEHWEIPHHAFLAAEAQGKGWAFGDAMFMRRFGFDGKPAANIVDRHVIRDIAAELGLDGTLVANASDAHDHDDVIETVRAQGEKDGVFGVPFFAFERDGETQRFWGNDRLPLVLETLREMQTAGEVKVGRAVGVGGLFFKSPDTKRILTWYREHLGLVTDEYGTNFEWRQADTGLRKGFTRWGPFRADTEYFNPSTRDFMFNYRVVNLTALLAQLADKGVHPVGEIQTFDYGRFAHIMDCDGNKVELWEPDDAQYQEMVNAEGGVTR